MGKRLSTNNCPTQKELTNSEGHKLCLSTMDLEVQCEPKDECKSQRFYILFHLHLHLLYAIQCGKYVI